MIGKAYAYIFNSRFGSWFFQIDKNDEIVEWTEKGMRRFFFYHFLLVFFLLINGTTPTFTGVIQSLLISLLIVEKVSRVVSAVMVDSDKFDFEEKDVRGTKSYRAMKNTLTKGEVDW